MAITEHHRPGTIMFAAIAGYGALTQRDEAFARELLQEHLDLLRDILPMFQGEEMKTTGDGLLVGFSSALAAVQCAVEIQRTLAERNEKKPEEWQIRVRIGIHVASLERRGDDVMGENVNIAAHVEALAEVGGVCITRPVFEQVEKKVPQSCVPLSKAELKNIPAGVAVYKLVLDAEPVSVEAAAFSRRLLYWMVLGVIVLNVVLFVMFGLKRKPGPEDGQTGTNSASQSLVTNQAPEIKR